MHNAYINCRYDYKQQHSGLCKGWTFTLTLQYFILQYLYCKACNMCFVNSYYNSINIWNIEHEIFFGTQISLILRNIIKEQQIGHYWEVPWETCPQSSKGEAPGNVSSHISLVNLPLNLKFKCTAAAVCVKITLMWCFVNSLQIYLRGYLLY